MRTSRGLGIALLLVASVLSVAPGGASRPAGAQTLSVLSWNVESEDAQPTTITPRIRAFQGIDVWGFAEVLDDSWAQAFEAAAEDGENADFQRILGTTGGKDRLAIIIYDATRLEEVRHFELPEINVGGNVRGVTHRRVPGAVDGSELPLHGQSSLPDPRRPPPRAGQAAESVGAIADAARDRGTP